MCDTITHNFFISALVTEPGGNDYAGTMLFQNPLQEAEKYISTTPLFGGDKTFRDSCCDIRLKNEYCNNFFDARTPTDILNIPIYRAPGVGK